MSVLVRIELSSEDIAAGGGHRWAVPVQDAIGEIAGVDVDIDSDGADGYVATIGTQAGSTLVVDLPPEANAWLDRQWQGDPVEPFAFDLVIDEWLRALVASGRRVEEAEAPR